jgi:hypothetical protein
MKRDLSALIEESKIRRAKTCSLGGLTGDVADYVAALEQLDYEQINKSKVKSILKSEFDLDPSDKKLYSHFNPAADCGC